MGPAMKIAIVGATSSNAQAPYDDPSWAIWTLNDLWQSVPRIDRLFEMHLPEVYRWSLRRPRGHVEFLKQFRGAVYLHEPDPEIPNATVYPLAAVVADIGVPYLTSGPAYMLALAVTERPEEIMVCGIDLSHQDYLSQRPCFEWLLGLAMGRGIRVLLPDGCPLLTGRLYGLGPQVATMSQYEARCARLEWLIAGAERDHEQARARSAEAKGRLLEAQHLLSLGLSDSPRIYERLSDLRDQSELAEVERSARWTEWRQLQGRLDETRAWSAWISAGEVPRVRTYAHTLAAASDGDDVLVTALKGGFDG